MSEKYENPCATYNIPLNIDENDVIPMVCAQLTEFLQINVKKEDWKPMMLKMHLELKDSPSIGEIKERNIERINNSDNGLKQSVEQLEEKDDVVNRIDKAPDIDNNAMQELNSKKQPNNENKLSVGHNDTENVASTSEGHHMTSMPEEKPKVIDLRDNCVYIQNFQCSDPSLEMAFCNICKLANEMNAEIPNDSILYIDIHEKTKNSLDYYVYFCDASIKAKFLKNRHHYAYNPETSPLRIFDYSEWGLVDIANVQTYDLSLETACTYVNGIAKKMKIMPGWNFIDHIDVFITKKMEKTKNHRYSGLGHIELFNIKPNFPTYSIRFKREFIRTKFLQSKYLLKEYPETNSLKISDAGGHRLSFRNVTNVSLSVASANVIGIAKLIGLSLTIDHFKHVYVLDHVPYFRDRDYSLIVEFSSQQVKDKFLKKKPNLMQLEYLKNLIEITDINAKKSLISIKTKYDPVTTVISFIRLAKQLGCLLNPTQIQHFFDLSKFIEDAKKSEKK